MKKSASWALDLADELRGNPLAMGESIENMSDFLGSLSKSKIIDLNRHCLDVVKVVFFFLSVRYISMEIHGHSNGGFSTCDFLKVYPTEIQ